MVEEAPVRDNLLPRCLMPMAEAQKQKLGRLGEKLSGILALGDWTTVIPLPHETCSSRLCSSDAG